MKEEKSLVRQREGNKCFICDSTDNLTSAHIFYWKKDGGKAVKENLVCLCRKCHNKLDFKKGIDNEEEPRLIKVRCEAYLVFLYCYNEFQEEIQSEIPIRRLKK